LNLVENVQAVTLAYSCLA